MPTWKVARFRRAIALVSSVLVSSVLVVEVARAEQLVSAPRRDPGPTMSGAAGDTSRELDSDAAVRAPAAALAAPPDSEKPSTAAAQAPSAGSSGYQRFQDGEGAPK
jgi:hypothetical protein